jgi:DNA-directed RNA polymerase specialized sigma24 family protein
VKRRDDLRNAVLELWAAGEPLKRIAAAIGITADSASQHVKRARKAGDVRAVERRAKTSNVQAQRQQILEDWVSELSLRAIAEARGVKSSTISSMLSRARLQGERGADRRSSYRWWKDGALDAWASGVPTVTIAARYHVEPRDVLDVVKEARRVGDARAVRRQQRRAN